MQFFKQSKKDHINSLNKEFAYCKNNPIHSPADIFTVNFLRLSSLTYQYKQYSYKRWYNAHSLSHIRSICNNKKTKTDNIFLNLKEYVLLFGGKEVCTTSNAEEATKLLDRGQLWFGDRLGIRRSQYDDINQDVSDFWSFNEDKVRIAKGYVLTPEGIWKQHSWLIQNKRFYNKIIDNTDENYLYFGYILTTNECNQFYWDNY